MVKKKEIITVSEKMQLTQPIVQALINLAGDQLWMFQGRGVFLESVHFDKYRPTMHRNDYSAPEKFQSFDSLILLKFATVDADNQGMFVLNLGILFHASGKACLKAIGTVPVTNKERRSLKKPSLKYLTHFKFSFLFFQLC